MAEKLRELARTNYAKKKASGLIENLCVPSGCENVIQPSSSVPTYRCRILSTDKVIINLEGRQCEKAIIDNRAAIVNKNGVILL